LVKENDDMVGPVETFRLLKGALTKEDLNFLKRACRDYLGKEDSIPSYVLLDILDAPTCQKIVKTIENETGQDVYYLNDFYIYSDDAFGAKWHMDTELFTFNDCLNAWILLSPHELRNPLAMLESPNESTENYYHSVKIEGDEATFVNYRNGSKKPTSLDTMEAEKIETPLIQEGDILLLNPKKFHKTNTTVPKHALVLKFVIKGKEGFFSESKVPPMFWSEIAIFTELLKKSDKWDDFLESLKQELKTPKGRKALSAGFFPEKIDLYKKMVATL
jgi:hypothetical protein